MELSDCVSKEITAIYSGGRELTLRLNGGTEINILARLDVDDEEPFVTLEVGVRTVGMDIIGTVNAEYTIIRQGKEAVIGHNPYKHSPYVCWSYWVDEGRVSFSWGRYGNESEASEAFIKKESGMYSGGAI